MSAVPRQGTRLQMGASKGLRELQLGSARGWGWDRGISGPRKLGGTGLRTWLKPGREEEMSRCGLGGCADIRMF